MLLGPDLLWPLSTEFVPLLLNFKVAYICKSKEQVPKFWVELVIPRILLSINLVQLFKNPFLVSGNSFLFGGCSSFLLLSYV